METSFELLIWRHALAGSGAVPSGTELAEWSEILAAAGAVEAAALLRNVAWLHRGSSPRAGAARAETTPATSQVNAPALGGTLDRAIDDLRALAREFAPFRLSRLGLPPAAGFSGRPDNAAGIDEPVPASPAPNDVAVAACELRAALEAAAADGAAAAGEIAAHLVEGGRRLAALDYRTFAGAPLTLLVPAIATAGLIDWALATRDLASAPLGSPLLLHRAAGLDHAGLGPYFCNVGRLIRDAADLFDLARIGAEAAGEGGEYGAISAWVVMLSRGCSGALLNEIVDELGDVDASDALTGILDRTVSRPTVAVDAELVFRIRDAALDNADFPLAARAQQAVARLRPDDQLEGIILGEIEASGGAFGRAEAIFRHWLERSPDDPRLRALLFAAKVDSFEQYRLSEGFGSPADRRETRLRRRGVVPLYPRRRGERIEAVDVR